MLEHHLWQKTRYMIFPDVTCVKPLIPVASSWNWFPPCVLDYYCMSYGAIIALCITLLLHGCWGYYRLVYYIIIAWLLVLLSRCVLHYYCMAAGAIIALCITLLLHGC